MNATWHSTTPTVKPVSNDRQYYFLPYWDEKPTMWIRATFPDHRRRLYNSNVIGKPADKLVCSLLYCFALILYYWHFMYTNVMFKAFSLFIHGLLGTSISQKKNFFSG